MALDGHLDIKLWKNFLLFTIVIRLLINPKVSADDINLAEQLVKNFVREYGELYGK